MSEQTAPRAATPAVTPVRALISLVALVPLVGGLLFLAQMIGVADFIFAGLVFCIYWCGIKLMVPREFLPALIGSLGGLGLAYLLHMLPAKFGVAGSVLVGAALAVSLFLLVRGQASVLINYAFMLMLTIATSLAFKVEAHFAAAAAAVVLAAAYAGGLMLIGTTLMSRNSKTAAEAPVG